ncbi:LLM class flavin-dependent oxidoreductase [Aromatoleum toluclasticum]|uniref:LLM class flavin-dependent oxidoreductase n=1 Tax=Aromatoleum toluclasticum TaxID=92003 RepID=UPI0003664B25|nr:LLM class flavin-dependent oxidoreductase [Aromatoleum toluclasticum]
MEFWTSFAGQFVLRGLPGAVPQNYDTLVATAVEAERLGFDGVVASEHHFEYNRFLPFPLQALGAAAAATSKIRLITGAMLLPLYDPIRAAEAAATVDILSGGRVTLGLGMGYRPMEFDGIGTAKNTRGARLSEQMEIIRLATSQERFSFQGKHYEYKDQQLSPRPLQRPIDMWFCGGTSRVGAQRAAAGGFDYWLANSDYDRTKEIVDIYLGLAREAGRPAERLRYALFRDVFVGDTLAEARDARDWFLEVYYNEHIRCYGYLMDDKGEPLFNPPFDHPAYVAFVDSLLCGTPDMVVTELKRFEQLGVHSITVPPVQLELFSNKVLPEFRK